MTAVPTQLCIRCPDLSYCSWSHLLLMWLQAKLRHVGDSLGTLSFDWIATSRLMIGVLDIVARGHYIYIVYNCIIRWPHTVQVNVLPVSDDHDLSICFIMENISQPDGAVKMISRWGLILRKQWVLHSSPLAKMKLRWPAPPLEFSMENSVSYHTPQHWSSHCSRNLPSLF